VASFWSKVRDSVKTTTTSIKDEINEAKSTPTQIQCTGCNCLLAIPEGFYDWKCQAGHVNQNSSNKCTSPSCQGLKPKNRGELPIKCPTCSALTSVPWTNGEKQIREAGRSIKSQVTYMKSKPTTFNCSNCDNLLLVPTGPWVCQTCNTVNAQELEKCSSCHQKTSEQKVICGICKRSTQVPSMNIVNSLSKGFRDLTKNTTKVYYDLRKSPYVTCPRCNTNMAVDPKASVDVKKQEEGVDGQSNYCSLQCMSCGMVLNYLPPTIHPASTASSNSSSSSIAAPPTFASSFLPSSSSSSTSKSSVSTMDEMQVEGGSLSKVT